MVWNWSCFDSVSTTPEDADEDGSKDLRLMRCPIEKASTMSFRVVHTRGILHPVHMDHHPQTI